MVVLILSLEIFISPFLARWSSAPSADPMRQCTLPPHGRWPVP